MIENLQFKKYNPIGSEEREAVSRVIESGVLSNFVASEGKFFLGGTKVKEAEALAAEIFKVKHAITVNSWTSGLICAVGALALEPGDEIITTPWTMCATATACLHWNVIPVFADIDPTTFCIDPAGIESKITDKTRAILAVDVFGQSCDIVSIKKIAHKYDLKIICDTAQAPLANIAGTDHFAGTMADIGGISLNYHKHIQCGEGGIIFTNDDVLAHRMKKIRNHGEAIASEADIDSLANNLGFNFRMGEIEAAITIEQLHKLPSIIDNRINVANKFTEILSQIKGISLPKIIENRENVFYVYPIVLTDDILIRNRSKIVERLNAMGLYFLAEGYVMVNRLPMYEYKIAYGKDNFPWSINKNANLGYGIGSCPNGDNLHDKSFIELNICMCEFADDEIKIASDAIIEVFNEVQDTA